MVQKVAAIPRRWVRQAEWRRLSWEEWAEANQKPESAIPPQVKEKIVLDYYNHFGKFLLTFTLNALGLGIS